MDMVIYFQIFRGRMIDVVNKLSEEFEFKVLNWACKR